MRLIFKLSLVSFFLALCVTTGFAQPQPKTAQTPVPAETSSGVIIFPEIEGWTKGEITRYPTVELGYSLPYRSEGGVVVTVYAYPGNNRTIPDSLDGIVKKEFEKAKSDIFAVGKQGVYKDVKEIKSETLVLGGSGGKIRALHALFTFSIQGRDVNSEIYLFPYQNRFIKIRATRPVSLGKEADTELAELLAELDSFLVKPGK
ncbi:MAG TPA: hypothetical protein VGO50_18370 [Pyrinomonadaceae bacterium]|jgi:hypothetical protein|nr:hypothetical protein [Pyrinomonadaceae bacterium]